MDLESIKPIADQLYPKFKKLKREWYRDSIVLHLRHQGRCEYCGLDLLSSQGICYHFGCADHLLPQATYPQLKDEIENKVLACMACNSIKGDYDPNSEASIYSSNSRLTAEQREQLLQYAKGYVHRQKAGLDAKFRQGLELLKPFIGT